MSSVVHAFHRITQMGADHPSDPRARRRVVVNNTIALLLGAAPLPVALLIYFAGLHVLGPTLALAGCSYAIPIWLNHKGHFAASRVTMVTFPNLIVVSYLFMGGVRGEATLFLVTVTLPLVICAPTDRATILWGVGLSLGCALLVTLGEGWMRAPLLSPGAGAVLHVVLLVMALLVLFVVVASFVLTNARAEASLHNAAAEREILLASIDQGLTTLDARGRIGRERSACFDKWFSGPAAGTPFAVCLAAVDPACGAAFERAFAEARAAGEAPEVMARRLPETLMAGGRYYRLAYKAGSGDVEHLLLVVVTDATDEVERARAEQLQRTLEAELAQAQKLESVGRLAAGVAHEINTPIQYVGDSIQFVRGAVDDLNQLLTTYQEVGQAVRSGRAGPADAERLHSAEEDADLPYLLEQLPKALDRALDGVSRVARIVQSMKEFAHPDSERHAAADLNRALGSTITVASNSFKQVAEVDTRFGTLPPVFCRLGSLNQVFLNLIVNAGDAIAERFAGTGERGQITIETRHDGNDVVIAVADDGGGIPEPVRARMFEQFFTTKPVGKGTGQGLAISRKIVSAHGGSIWFETAVGKGTTFFIRLPVQGGAGA